MAVKLRRVLPLISRTYAWGRNILRGIGKFQHERRRWMILAEVRQAETADVLANLDALDGLMINSDDMDLIGKLVEHRIPFVNFNATMHRHRVPAPCVPNDETAIGAMAAEHLLGLGLSSLGFCGVTASIANSKRGESFLKAVRKAASRCSVIECRYDYQPLNLLRDNRDPLVAWLKSLPKPAGVMAYNDLIARHVAEACMLCGLQVPQDVAIIGVDNDELACELAAPPLSSIDVGSLQQGYIAAQLLEEWMAGRPPGRVLRPVLPAQVVRRQSTDVIAIDDAVVVRALSFIQNHFASAISVDDVAAAADVSRRNLEYRFNAILESSPQREIQRRRIQHARELLSSTGLPIASIAESCGFARAGYFSEVFLRETGKTPAEFRTKYA